VTPREIRFAVNGLTSIVVLSVAAAMANLTWRLAGAGSSPSTIAAAMDAYVPPAPPPDISGMINLPPFGRAVVATTAGSAPADMILRGVLMAVPASASSALIATAGKEAAAYRLGDPLPGGMILDAIGVDYVVLRLGVQNMTLYFPGDERTGHAPTATLGASGAATPPPGLRDIKTLLPPSLTGRAAPAEVSGVPPPLPPPPQAPSQITGSGSGSTEPQGAAGAAPVQPG
jgi:general secretion pathway protein C